ncbi:VOC family protein [Niabella ginsengisoli]|uniref:VOC family protein n=1 Tax=Niabella ginsengisoli TaxID=522298 RepID=A0ABS9SRA3_9BACT|nr:VOC family protein [Niabella ginsengisoli]MCH5600756.1 VOC family protein [Niabella ginsengisoli]
MKIPKGHQPLMPYLILKNADAFIEFTKVVFGATEIFKSYRDNDNKIIMHAEVQINGCNIMFADMNEFYGVANGNLFIYVEDADKTAAVALENGAKIINELADQDYGRSGGIEDPFGNVWWLTSMK